MVIKEMALSLSVKLSRLNNPTISSFICGKIPYGYNKFPNNNELPQHSRMIYAQFREHIDHNYIDIPSKIYAYSKGNIYE